MTKQNALPMVTVETNLFVNKHLLEDSSVQMEIRQGKKLLEFMATLLKTREGSVSFYHHLTRALKSSEYNSMFQAVSILSCCTAQAMLLRSRGNRQADRASTCVCTLFQEKVH